MESDEHPRRILHAFIPIEVCKELEFIHKGNCTVGYRPNVFSTTLSHLIATNLGHLIMPFVLLRERLKEQVEQAFGCEYELFIEFTGLISWTKGSSIGWHSDDNRPYLKQRAFAAVCYLNSYEEHFSGGLFHFQDGEPSTITPKAGDVALYSADSRNINSVDEIESGERLTLTLWFTRDASHDEDAKLISLLLAQNISSSNSLSEPLSLLIPLPASSNMYWFSSGTESGEQKCLLEFDVCVVRLAILGYDVCSVQEESSNVCELDASSGSPSGVILEKPLWLVREDALLNVEFGNILHALQVVQFYRWKEESLPQEAVKAGLRQTMSESQRETTRQLRKAFLKDPSVAEKVFVHPTPPTHVNSKQHEFSEERFCGAVKAWEDYSHNLHKQLLTSLPVWKTHQWMFDIVPPDQDAASG